MDTVDVRKDDDKCKLPPHAKCTVQMPVERNALEYKMSHKNRGLALIFNHETYKIPDMETRKGTQVDCANLEEALKKLYFDVAVHNDCTYSELVRHVEHAASHDHSQNDCLLVAILTHGENGYLFAKDVQYKFDRIWQYFLAHNCPTLAGKPKIFFIQACRGSECDAGITMVNKRTGGETETDSASFTNNSYTLPIHADFLFAYATVPGFYSWRNTESGSWFIEALVKELNENGSRMDILSLLTFVNQRVAINYESDVPTSLLKHRQKQIPCIVSMLTRILRFTEKSTNNNGTGVIYQ